MYLTAKRNVQSAQGGYTAGQVDFLRLIQAQRELIELSEQAIQAQAELHARLAMLERVVGGVYPDLKRSQLGFPHRRLRATRRLNRIIRGPAANMADRTNK